MASSIWGGDTIAADQLSRMSCTGRNFFFFFDVSVVKNVYFLKCLSVKNPTRFLNQCVKVTSFSINVILSDH